MKGMKEPQVNASKSHTATGKNFSEAICHSSSQMYLHCVLSGISRLNKKKEQTKSNTALYVVKLQMDWSLQNLGSIVPEIQYQEKVSDPLELFTFMYKLVL